MPDRVLVSAEDGAKDILAISERHYHDLRGRSDFPKPIQLGPRCLRWRVDELLEWAYRQPRQEPQPEPLHLRSGRKGNK